MPLAPPHTAAFDSDELVRGDEASDVSDVGADPLAGTQYRAIGRLGQGGMGEVFLADHIELGRRFVVKLLHSAMAENPRLVDRMRIEAQALARLEHPHIVEVNNFGKTPGGRPFIVMERLRGATLADELRQRGAFDVREAIRLVRQVLSALGAAHEIGLVHRDIKLSNLFLHERPGQPPIVKVLDFGIAKVIAGISPNAPRPLLHPTEEGVVLGTPRYMSPEAILALPVDHRSDLYSVGLVLYTLLAGRGPWHEEPLDREVLVKQVRERPEPPSAYARERERERERETIVVALDRAVMKLLEKRPEDRFQSAHEVDDELAAIERQLPADPDNTHDSQAWSEPGSRAARAASAAMVEAAATRGAAGRTVPDIEPTEPVDATALTAQPPDTASTRPGTTLELSSSEPPVPLAINDEPTHTAVERGEGVVASALPAPKPSSAASVGKHAVRRAVVRHPVFTGVIIAVASTLLAWWLLDVLLRVIGD